MGYEVKGIMELEVGVAGLITNLNNDFFLKKIPPNFLKSFFDFSASLNLVSI